MSGDNPTPSAGAVEPPVLVRREGRLGHLVLNRPRAINALDHQMVQILTEALLAWRDDPEISAVLLTGAGERGLCAGGDIVAIWKDAVAGTTESAGFWTDEYRLNHLISTYPVPFVAVMDGIVLGGGIGLSAHASHRVVTERSTIGMPETGIGFVPDVGGTWLLSRAPGELGTHLALTAGRADAGDALAIGLADHFVPSDRLDELAARLVGEPAEAVLADLAGEAPASELLAQAAWVDETYAGDDAAAILARLEQRGEPAAAKAAKAMGRNSPTALTVTLAALRAARDLPDLAAALRTELRLTVRFLRVPDFAEGIRAQVVDKDRNPAWNPPTLAEVAPETYARLSAPLDEAVDGAADLTLIPASPTPNPR